MAVDSTCIIGDTYVVAVSIYVITIENCVTMVTIGNYHENIPSCYIDTE